MSAPQEDEELRVQREVTSIALQALGQTSFVLAGSGAIREHGLTARSTEDIDLFTNRRDPDAFATAAAAVTDGLTAAGYDVRTLQQAAEFLRAGGLPGAAVPGRPGLPASVSPRSRSYPPSTLSTPSRGQDWGER